MSIRAKNAHFPNWAKVVEALSSYGVTNESSARTFLKNAKTNNVANPFYYMVCYIKDSREIYTHGQFYKTLSSNLSDLDTPNILFGSGLEISPEENVILFDSDDLTVKLGSYNEYNELV